MNRLKIIITTDRDDMKHVEAWQPLPDPYEGGE